MESKDNIKNNEEESIEELRLQLRRRWVSLIHHPKASSETKKLLSKTLEDFIK